MRPSILLILLCLMLERGETQTQSRRILIVYEAGTAYPGINLIDQGIRDALNSSPFKLEVYREYMDSVLFPDPTDQQRIRDFVTRKYQDRRPDVIVTAGPTPLKFMEEVHYTAFAGVPIVFCLPHFVPSPVSADSHFTGVLNELNTVETIQEAVRLQPGTNHIIVVGGTSFADNQLENVIKQELKPLEGDFDISYLTTLPMVELLERLRHLPKHTIVLFTSLSQDGAGTKFISGSEATSMVAAAANAPVFVTVDVALNHGEVGGRVSSLREQGRIAGELVLRVLKGAKPYEIPRVSAGTIFMFDWRALKRWGLQEKNLPPGSIVLNREQTVWESHKWYIVGGVSLILLEALLIAALLWHRARRKKAEQTLRESEERFRLVANTAPVMIWMSGTDKLCNYFNQPWLEFTGRPLESEVGNGWAEGVHKEDLDTCFKTYSGSFDRRETFRMEYRLRRCDGEYRWVSNMGVPRFDPDGSFAGYIGSCIDVTEQKLAGEALATIGRRLIEAHEEERTWIGRELHDDINQRLALLAVELDNWSQHPPSKAEFHKYVLTVTQRITDLGKDVQALSHRLHSSKLEYLGLASAAASFCRELAEQRKVEIDFSQSGIPRNLPKEVSLSLFRVLQESLQNAVKYSGVGHFSVELHGTPSEIQLIVNDLGAGFDEQQVLTSRGLGLISMRERLQMVSGEFSVKSEPGRGTTVWARVPVKMDEQRASMAG